MKFILSLALMVSLVSLNTFGDGQEYSAAAMAEFESFLYPDSSLSTSKARGGQIYLKISVYDNGDTKVEKATLNTFNYYFQNKDNPEDFEVVGDFITAVYEEAGQDVGAITGTLTANLKVNKLYRFAEEGKVTLLLSANLALGDLNFKLNHADGYHSESKFYNDGGGLFSLSGSKPVYGVSAELGLPMNKSQWKFKGYYENIGELEGDIEDDNSDSRATFNQRKLGAEIGFQFNRRKCHTVSIGYVNHDIDISIDGRNRNVNGDTFELKYSCRLGGYTRKDLYSNDPREDADDSGNYIRY